MAAATTSWPWRGEVRDMNPDHQEMGGSEGSLRLGLMDEGSRKTFAWHPLSPSTASVHHLSLLHLKGRTFCWDSSVNTQLPFRALFLTILRLQWGGSFLSRSTGICQTCVFLSGSQRHLVPSNKNSSSVSNDILFYWINGKEKGKERLLPLSRWIILQVIIEATYFLNNYFFYFWL